MKGILKIKNGFEIIVKNMWSRRVCVKTMVAGSKTRIETRIKSAKSSKLEPLKNTRTVPTLLMKILFNSNYVLMAGFS